MITINKTDDQKLGFPVEFEKMFHENFAFFAFQFAIFARFCINMLCEKIVAKIKLKVNLFSICFAFASLGKIYFR